MWWWLWIHVHYLDRQKYSDLLGLANGGRHYVWRSVIFFGFDGRNLHRGRHIRMDRADHYSRRRRNI